MCICSFNDVKGGGGREGGRDTILTESEGVICFVARFHYFIPYFSNDGGGKGEREAVLYLK